MGLYLQQILARLQFALRKLKSSSFRGILGSFLLLIVTGTVGYSLIEGWTLQESLYFVIITITTVGYGDYSPKTPQGQSFAIVFTLVAIGLAGYTISSLAATIFELQSTKTERKLRINRMSQLSKLENHTIICGATLLAQRAANEFRIRQAPFVIIEDNEETLKKAMLWMHDGYIEKFRTQLEYTGEKIDMEIEEQKSIAQLAAESNVLYIIGDPTDERVLDEANLGNAHSIITALADDRDNISIILSVKDMCMKMNNTDIRIVSAAYDTVEIRRLYLAGAHKVVSPDFIGGLNVATHILDPEVGEMYSQMIWNDGKNKNTRMHDFRLNDNPEFIGKSKDVLCKQSKMTIIALKRNGEYTFSPDADTIFQKNDILIVVGGVGIVS